MQETVETITRISPVNASTKALEAAEAALTDGSHAFDDRRANAEIWLKIADRYMRLAGC